jgi:ankyrin repeat protein
MSLPTVFVVLDALDEAGERVQDHIVREISELPIPDVRLFCTSRPFSRFDELFRDSPKIEIRAMDEDIRTFVKAQIEERSRLHKLVRTDEKLQEDIMAKIIEMAEGMYVASQLSSGILSSLCCEYRFLMARLHIDSVATGASKTNIRQALQSLPSGINNTYKQTMKRIRGQPDRDKMLAERALSWVFCSRRQLNIIELQHGLAVMDMEPGGEEVTEDDLPHEDIIISVCQGLLIQERKGHERAFIRPVHYTAAEYFTKAHVEEFPHGQAEIATACVTYLSLSRLSHNLSCYLSELEREHEEDEVAYHYGGSPIGPKSQPWKYRPVIWDCFPLFFYAGEHWGTHLCEAHLLGLPISTSNIFWQYHSNSFKWAYWLVPPETSYHTKLYDDIYLVVSKSYGAVLTVLEKFVEKDHDVNGVDDDGRTMLFYAVNAGHEDAIKFLLALDDIEINEPDLEGNDPLSAAIDRDLKGVVQSLLSMIAVRGNEDSDEHQEAEQDSKRPRGFYSPERIRSLQVRASRMSRSTYGTEVLRMLLDKTEDFDPQDGRAFLLLAIEKGSLYNSEFLTFLLERDLDLQARDESGNTALHMAAKKKEHFLVKELLRRGADAGAVNSAGWTPLQTAMGAGSFIVFLQLLKSSTADMRMDLKFDEGSSAWSEKDEQKEIERRVISLLIQQEFTSAQDPDGRTALSWAAEHASLVAMDFLLELDWDINSCDHSGRTALSYAAGNKHHQAEDIVKMLLQAGADPGIKDSLGKTPILHAAERSSYWVHGVISELLKAGADANAKDASGTVVLDHIVAGKYFADRNTSQTIEELLGAGMDPNVKNSSGKTALFSITDKVYKANDSKLQYAEGILWMLLAAGADPNIKDAMGKTPQDYALDRGNPSLSVPFLIHECLQLGGDVNSKDASGKTPLFYVTESQTDSSVQVRMVKALLDAGANPNIQDDTGRTPIFAAGYNEDGGDVWEALEKGGAKLDIKDTSGRRPYRSRHRRRGWW